MTKAQRILARAEQNLTRLYHIDPEQAGALQLHEALSQAVMEEIAPRWKACEEKRSGGKMACYLSAEYLIGRQIHNNLYCAGILEETDALLKGKGLSLAALEDVEDAALGNGGLGRLAACYLDSAAARDIPLMGYGLRYRYGLFKQSFRDCAQVEAPEDWSRYGDPWSLRREELAVQVDFRDYSVRAVPYDMPIIGYKNDVVGTLRLWETECPDGVDFEAFQSHRYAKANRSVNRAEDIVKFLYPNDDARQGKILRLRQQYVLASASIQDMLRRVAGNEAAFPTAFAVQLNDTHPVMAIPELIRLLMEKGMPFEKAFVTARDSFAFTNHTVMREALEVWDLGLIRAVAPGLVPVLLLIEKRLADEGWGLSILRSGQVHMAELAVYGSRSVNGVAEIHSGILKDRVFREWYGVLPGRFLNVTNGVTQRRWLGLCNPELTGLLKRALGNDDFLLDLDLSALRDRITPELSREFARVKRQKKEQLSRYILQKEGIWLDPSFLFDVQVKRLHEYKRQLLNALCALAIYRELKAGKLPGFAPTALIFGAKAAASYRRAKAVIRLINRIAEMVNGDPAVNDRLKVVFVTNYNCSYAERIIPAADLSEQISSAGTEASGTGNMKMMLNGAVTLGTMDGANIEIAEQAGLENFFPFGAGAEELERLRDHYDPLQLYNSDGLLKEVVDALDDGTFQDPEGEIAGLKDSLLKETYNAPDTYFVLKDFRPYYEAKRKANAAYRDIEAFSRMALMNIAGAGKFSSDRSVLEYEEKIWRTGGGKRP